MNLRISFYEPFVACDDDNSLILSILDKKICEICEICGDFLTTLREPYPLPFPSPALSAVGASTYVSGVFFWNRFSLPPTVRFSLSTR